MELSGWGGVKGWVEGFTVFLPETAVKESDLDKIGDDGQRQGDEGQE